MSEDRASRVLPCPKAANIDRHPVLSNDAVMSVKIINWGTSQNEKASSIVHLGRESLELTIEYFQGKRVLTDISQTLGQRYTQ